jgi:uncharacterized protein YlaI
MQPEPLRFARTVCRECGHWMRQQKTCVLAADAESLQEIAGQIRQVRRTRILYYVCPACDHRAQDAQTETTAVL